MQQPDPHQQPDPQEIDEKASLGLHPVAPLTIDEKAHFGLRYQKAIADLRPADVYERIHRIHRHVLNLEEKVIGKAAVDDLTEVEFLFRAFYTGRTRESFR